MRIRPDTKVTDIIDSHERRLRWMELGFLVILVIRVAQKWKVIHNDPVDNGETDRRNH